MMHKFDGSQVNENYQEGYVAGLMNKSANSNDTIDFRRGYNDATNDLLDFEPENCC